MKKTNIKSLSVVFSSHLTENENIEFINHLKSTVGLDIHVECIVNKNKYSLTKAYNMGWEKLDRINRGNDIIIFCHNDIVIRTQKWGKIILNLFNYKNNYYDIIGIAGATSIYNGCWWLNENGDKMNSNNMYGAVYHTNGIREWLSYYNKCNILKEAVLVDGLFIAVNGEYIEKRFDERFDNYHFYDISFCIENYLEGNNIGITDRINILHKSIGETDENWEKNRKLFIDIYKDELPIILND